MPQNQNSIAANYPNGFEVPPIIRQMPIAQTANGNVYWVDSTASSTGNYGTKLRPCATITTALALCTANKGDIIFVGSKHVETVTAAGGINVNVAGVSIIGVQNGDDRPTITFSTATTASMTITAANVTIKGLVGVAGINALANPIDIANGADGCTVEVHWRDPSNSIEAVRAIRATTVNRLKVYLRYEGRTGGSSCVNAIRLNGCNEVHIAADFYGKASTGWVEFITAACTGVRITGQMYNSGTTNYTKDVVDTVTGSKWVGDILDGAAGAQATGGDNAALATNSISAVSGIQEAVATSSTAVMVNGNTIFTVAGGPILIQGLVSECVTANDATASTVQYQVAPTIGTATTISGASASIANAAAGASVTLQGTALATAALYAANGPSLIANPGTIYAPAGTIKVVIGVGSTTGTWRHRIRYKPLVSGVTVS